MTNEQKMAFLMHLDSLIWQSKLAQSDITQVSVAPQWMPFIAMGGRGRWFGKGLRGFDVDLRVENGQTIQLRVLEQNPFKVSPKGGYSSFALRAQRGERIAWIIDRRVQNGFLGHLANGEFIPSSPRPVYNTNTYTPPAQNSAAQYMGGPAYVDETIPEIPPGSDIPEYVMQSFGDEPIDIPEFDGGDVDDLFAGDFDPDMV